MPKVAEQQEQEVKKKPRADERWYYAAHGTPINLAPATQQEAMKTLSDLADARRQLRDFAKEKKRNVSHFDVMPNENGDIVVVMFFVTRIPKRGKLRVRPYRPFGPSGPRITVVYRKTS